MFFRRTTLIRVLSVLALAALGPPVLKAAQEENRQRDQQFRKLALGTWEDDYQGRRTMTLEADGKAQMIVELSGIKARLFAPKLEFDMEWSLENGRLKKRTVGGKPAVKVQMILKMMGDRVDEQILELSEDRLLLQDQDGKTQYDWRRVKPEDDAPAEVEPPSSG